MGVGRRRHVMDGVVGDWEWVPYETKLDKSIDALSTVPHGLFDLFAMDSCQHQLMLKED